MPEPEMPEHVRAAYAAFPAGAQKALAVLRRYIFEEAARLGAGPIEETLKWGEPAYLTAASKSGSTIRLGWSANRPDHCAIFLNCQTDLVSTISTHFPEAFEYEGNRALRMRLGKAIPEVPARAALAMALTYHRDKRRSA